ncbi:hypothetical protein Pan181_28190 [Aeoliella mucimassa]|uniref:Alpha/beta hydrolase domain-containing protein n=2 Tax=Aeoliella mucimassa TaxID=2527972 RepID=A0A518APF5_9BACT|nr:hypothetical protein Pan181_28190 [Aeoliella mucimassa]
MLSRREILTQLTAGVAGSMLLPSLPVLAAEPVSSITGPITGGRRGHPFSAFVDDLDTYGYVEEEYFLEGDAVQYRPTTDLSKDGKWDVEPGDKARYKTRLLVRRPKDPAKFNGTVVVEWLNVTVGWEIALLGSVSRDLYRDGFAFVMVSCQQIGLNGFALAPQGLKRWDPDRYGTLSTPGDSYSFDMFSQAGRAVGPTRPSSSVDPLGGLEVKQVIATGASQSAGRLRTYMNAIHPRDQVFDAYMPMIDFGVRVSFDDKVLDLTVPSSSSPDTGFFQPTCIRDDLDVPTIVVNSETETLFSLATKQPDTEKFRFWEVAGASHAPQPNSKYMESLRRRDGLMGASLSIGSKITWQPTADAALVALARWAAGGTAPAEQARIEVTEGTNPQVVRDEHGNARGGVRLPEVEVPIACNKGETAAFSLASLYGTSKPLPSEVLKQLYPTPEVYQQKVSEAAEAALKAGVIRPGRVDEYVEQAKHVQV